MKSTGHFDPPPLIRPVEADKTPRGIAYRDGFRILGTPLGFKNARDAGLRFIASLDDRPPRGGERVLMHRAAALALCKRDNADILAVDFGQKIKLGRLEIELFPSGMGFGAAQLRLSLKDRRILYCGGIRTARPLFSPPAEIPSCDVLLVDVACPEGKMSAPSRTATELVSWVETALSSGTTAVVFGNRTAALDGLCLLGESFPTIHASRAHFEMYQRCAAFVGTRGRILRADRLPGSGVLATAADTWPKSRFFSLIDKERTAYVGPNAECPSWASAAFRLGAGEDRAGLAAYVRRTGATHVVLGQTSGESEEQSLLKTEAHVHRIVRPTQIPLPFP